MRNVSDHEAARQEPAEPPRTEPEFESTRSKLERGALPPNDPLVRLHEAILGLRSLIKS